MFNFDYFGGNSRNSKVPFTMSKGHRATRKVRRLMARESRRRNRA